MNETNRARNQITGADWQFFGEFAAPVGQNMDRQIYTWLVECLRPLNLKEDFLDKITASARSASASDSTGDPPAGWRTIRVYATSSGQPPGQTWGFFRTEKKDGTPANEPYRHTITFYLYLEKN